MRRTAAVLLEWICGAQGDAAIGWPGRRVSSPATTAHICSAETGLVFIDLIDNIEKIGDHLTNIAQAIIGGLQWEGIKPKISADS